MCYNDEQYYFKFNNFARYNFSPVWSSTDFNFAILLKIVLIPFDEDFFIISLEEVNRGQKQILGKNIAEQWSKNLSK